MSQSLDKITCVMSLALVYLYVHLEGLQQTSVSPVLQLVVLSHLAQTHRGLTLSVQLIMEVVQ